MKAGSDLIRRVINPNADIIQVLELSYKLLLFVQVNKSRHDFVEIDPNSSPEDKLFSASMRSYTSGIASNPQSTDAYYKRGYAQYRHGHYQDALADFTRAVDLNPCFTDGWYLRLCDQCSTICTII